jgi:hypothetical protein
VRLSSAESRSTIHSFHVDQHWNRELFVTGGGRSGGVVGVGDGVIRVEVARVVDVSDSKQCQKKVTEGFEKCLRPSTPVAEIMNPKKNN